VQAGSGAVLIAMGVLVLTGELFRLNLDAQQLLESLGLSFFQDV
jgi:cytochrome c-type biogenesis protein